MKKGDTIYCKKNFYLSSELGPCLIVKEGNEYKIDNIRMEYWKPLGDCTVFILKNDNNNDLLKTIPERYIPYHFLTMQEYRNLKLEKLNERSNN